MLTLEMHTHTSYKAERNRSADYIEIETHKVGSLTSTEAQGVQPFPTLTCPGVLRLTGRLRHGQNIRIHMKGESTLARQVKQLQSRRTFPLFSVSVQYTTSIHHDITKRFRTVLPQIIRLERYTKRPRGDNREQPNLRYWLQPQRSRPHRPRCLGLEIRKHASSSRPFCQRGSFTLILAI